jgi:hypothetical protein
MGFVGSIDFAKIACMVVHYNVHLCAWILPRSLYDHYFELTYFDKHETYFGFLVSLVIVDNLLSCHCLDDEFVIYMYMKDIWQTWPNKPIGYRYGILDLIRTFICTPLRLNPRPFWRFHGPKMCYITKPSLLG